MSGFYKTIEELDRLTGIKKPSKEATQKLLRIIDSKPEYCEYCFRNCDNPAWFEPLYGVILNIPVPKEMKEEGTIQFPNWWPGQYLLKVADKIPDKVATVLKDIETDNWVALSTAMEIILKLPSLAHAKTLLPTIDKWLDTKYAESSLIDKYAIDLMAKFAEAGDFDGLFELFKILSKPVKAQKRHKGLRIDIYHYNKYIKEQYFPVLIKEKCKDVIELIEHNLKEAILLEDKKLKNDVSTIWRPAIEDNPENYTFNDLKDIFLEMLRDALVELAKPKPEAIKDKIEQYLVSEYGILRRLAIHLIRVCIIKDYLAQVLVNRDNLDDRVIYHEYYLLAKENFGSLSNAGQEQVADWILAGPQEEKDEKYVRPWCYRRLQMIKEYVDTLPQKEILEKRLKEYGAEYAKEEHPDLLSHRTSWVGPESPIDKETIRIKMAEGKLIDYLRDEFNPTGKHWTPTPEGLARLLMDVVKDDPAPFAQIADKFYWKGIYPAYITDLLRGFQEAWKDRKDFEWEQILSLCEIVVKVFDDPQIGGERDRFDFGTFEDVRGAVADLLGESVKQDKHHIPDVRLPKVKAILKYIIGTDPDPTSEDEAKYGGDNMDYVTYAINCNRGKAMEALFQYALCFARINADKGEEAGKGPFPPGQRLESDMKDFLEKCLKEETSPSVHSMFGKFFIYLYYLDQEWTTKILKSGQIFPSAEAKKIIWEADWCGYMFFSNFYKQMYELLRDNYERAIDDLPQEEGKKREPENDRLAEHIMIAYLLQLEDITSGNSLVIKFFNRASTRIRERAISFMGSSLRQMMKDDEKSAKEKWPLFKELWEYRLESINDEELIEFISWVEYAPENIEQLSEMIKKSIKLTKGVRFGHNILDYLLANAPDYPKASIDILVHLLKIKRSNQKGYLDPVDMRKIIEEARKHSECKGLVNEAVNVLGELGYYNFRDLLLN
ncbi:MAG: hypothetical protein NT099_06080 [Candidatus Saganbacteria bacterium]|nr:hypothetical protein [Candidatus Saganbacteria bacterium]